MRGCGDSGGFEDSTPLACRLERIQSRGIHGEMVVHSDDDSEDDSHGDGEPGGEHGRRRAPLQRLAMHSSRPMEKGAAQRLGEVAAKKLDEIFKGLDTIPRGGSKARLGRARRSTELGRSRRPASMHPTSRPASNVHPIDML